MAKLVTFLSAIVLLALPLLGCAASVSASEVTLGQAISLANDQEVKIKGEDLSVKFLGVVADSRCPTGVT